MNKQCEITRTRISGSHLISVLTEIYYCWETLCWLLGSVCFCPFEKKFVDPHTQTDRQLQLTVRSVGQTVWESDRTTLCSKVIHNWFTELNLGSAEKHMRPSSHANTQSHPFENLTGYLNMEHNTARLRPKHYKCPSQQHLMKWVVLIGSMFCNITDSTEQIQSESVSVKS